MLPLPQVVVSLPPFAFPIPIYLPTATLILFSQGPATPVPANCPHASVAAARPLLGCNWHAGLPLEDHEWFKQFDDQGAPAFRFFLEPVVLTINYALSLGYKHVVMTGLSGGGWTTTVAAAVDPRITLSMPVAGSIPCSFTHTSWDFEQWGACGANGARPWPANYTDMYDAHDSPSVTGTAPCIWRRQISQAHAPAAHVAA